MEPTPAKPIKKRRRWLIVAFVLVTVSIVSWWHWPRGDARFVGKWQMRPRGIDMVLGEFEFRSNGASTYRDQRRRSSLAAPWRVDGQKLVVGYEKGPLAPVSHRVSAVIHRRTGWWPLPDASSYDFRVLDPSSIEICSDPTDPNNCFELRRIPE